MYYLIIIIGIVFYYLYTKGYFKLTSERKSEDTRKHVLKKAKEKYEKGELSDTEYESIKKDLERD